MSGTRDTVTIMDPQVAQWLRICLPVQEDTESWVWFLGQADPLEKEMAICSSILAWKIQWTEEPGSLQFMGLQRVRHDSIPGVHCGSDHEVLISKFRLQLKKVGKTTRPFKYGRQCMLSCIRLFATLWIVAHETPPSMGFSRKQYWRGLPFPTPGDLHTTGIKPGSPAMAVRFFTTSAAWEAKTIQAWLKSNPL